MAQPSVANYFNKRRRTAVDDGKIIKAKKVLVLDRDNLKTERHDLKDSPDVAKSVVYSPQITQSAENPREGVKLIADNICSTVTAVAHKSAKKKVAAIRVKKLKDVPGQRNIYQIFNNIAEKKCSTALPDALSENADTVVESIKLVTPPSTPTKNVTENEKFRHVTPPSTPTKIVNALDKVNVTGKEPTMAEMKRKLSRSARLAELKASMTRFKVLSGTLEQAEERTAQIMKSPTIKNFKSIELEVNLSPRKVVSPEKQYLSPKKDTSARKNLLNLLSPTKNALPIPASPRKSAIETLAKPALTLPYKYRFLAEVFRAMDTVSQIMYNRKEAITFRKLKPGVEKMINKNFTMKHLAQVKSVYPEAYKYSQEKLRVYGVGTRKEEWELVIVPETQQETMTSELLLERRRIFFSILIEKLKDYHQEFLMTLDVPMVIPREKITHWHAHFDIEKVPDIQDSSLPEPPSEEKILTGKDMLQKAKTMFNCNTFMERALEKLKEKQLKNPEPVADKLKEVSSVLKGIPIALLEKVRQKQAAKALAKITRSADQEKEVLVYSRLPEIARLTRSLFVSERKNVLPIDVVIEKLSNSSRIVLTRNEMELYLKTIEKEVPGWLVFHDLRGAVLIRLSKNADLSLVINRLDTLAKQKMDS